MSRDEFVAGDEPTPSEIADAEEFGDRVDRLLIGEPLPPAMDSEDRSVLEMATIIVASTGELPLSPTRSKNIVEQALTRAGGGSVRERPMSVSDLPEGARTKPGITPLAAARKSRLRAAIPWTAAALSAAAAVALFFTRPQVQPTAPAEIVRVERQLPLAQRSRESDALIGRIPRERAAEASDRIQLLYADRLSGYRSLQLSRQLGDSQ